MSGEIAYFIGTYVVLYDRASNVQRHYKEHTNDVKWYDVCCIKTLYLLVLFSNRTKLSVFCV
jgi:hypothetical protein